MSILNDTSQVSNIAIIFGCITYILKLFVEKKYGLRFKSDIEMVDYLLDKGIDKALVTSPKIEVLKRKFFGQKSAETGNKTNPVASIPIPATEVIQPRADMSLPDVGLVLSEMQLDVDYIKDKLTKTLGIDFSNGDEEEEEIPEDNEVKLVKKDDAWKKFMPDEFKDEEDK